MKVLKFGGIKRFFSEWSHRKVVATTIIVALIVLVGTTGYVIYKQRVGADAVANADLANMPSVIDPVREYVMTLEPGVLEIVAGKSFETEALIYNQKGERVPANWFAFEWTEAKHPSNGNNIEAAHYSYGDKVNADITIEKLNNENSKIKITNNSNTANLTHKIYTTMVVSAKNIKTGKTSKTLEYRLPVTILPSISAIGHVKIGAAVWNNNNVYVVSQILDASGAESTIDKSKCVVSYYKPIQSLSVLSDMYGGISSNFAQFKVKCEGYPDFITPTNFVWATSNFGTQNTFATPVLTKYNATTPGLMEYLLNCASNASGVPNEVELEKRVSSDEAVNGITTFRYGLLKEKYDVFCGSYSVGGPNLSRNYDNIFARLNPISQINQYGIGYLEIDRSEAIQRATLTKDNISSMDSVHPNIYNWIGSFDQSNYNFMQNYSPKFFPIVKKSADSSVDIIAGANSLRPIFKAKESGQTVNFDIQRCKYSYSGCGSTYNYQYSSASVPEVPSSWNADQVKSSDSLRLSYADQLKSALEKYKSAKGSYPATVEVSDPSYAWGYVHSAEPTKYFYNTKKPNAKNGAVTSWSKLFELLKPYDSTLSATVPASSRVVYLATQSDYKLLLYSLDDKDKMKNDGGERPSLKADPSLSCSDEKLPEKSWAYEIFTKNNPNVWGWGCHYHMGSGVVDTNSAKVSARDAQRKTDLNNLKNAINAYAKQTSNSTPKGLPASDGWIAIEDMPNSNDSLAETILKAKTITNIPCDPLINNFDKKCNSGSGNYMYWRHDYKGGGKNEATLYATLENPTDADKATVDPDHSTIDSLAKSYGMNYRIEVKQ